MSRLRATSSTNQQLPIGGLVRIVHKVCTIWATASLGVALFRANI
jgi:hypothetical protein